MNPITTTHDTLPRAHRAAATILPPAPVAPLSKTERRIWETTFAVHSTQYGSDAGAEFLGPACKAAADRAVAAYRQVAK